ncbi:hypothetical protein EST38_g4284 [Candolleomyces aberdarensis]|uniref:Uncharacterized protein n=1 Tax=Candolleomyces aberdarensis TaxID=2316362 RepID=A0A4Q2DNC8_9AGAR|nr:hypothetical protein EST38_g4284 [Candolleomyces aberdarensis]
MRFAIFATAIVACMTAAVSASPIPIAEAAPVAVAQPQPVAAAPVAREPLPCRLLRMCF